jgi:DNA-binding NarL/FixJ family response regulator
MSITVFLADDHAVVRDGLRAILEAHDNVEVIGDAANGRDTVNQVAQLCPDVAIIDIAMPQLNGIDATQRILKRNPSVKVVILSVYSTTEYILRALKAGALGYVLKESAGSEVISAIQAVYNGDRYLSQRILKRVIDDYLHRSEKGGVVAPMTRLSLREREIMQLVVEGKTSEEISQILCISAKTVDTHRSRLMKKLNVKDIVGLIKFSMQHDFTSTGRVDSASDTTTG